MEPTGAETKTAALPGGWRRRRLGDLIAGLETGVSVRSAGSGAPMSGRKAVLKTSAVSNGRFDPSECKPVAADEVDRVRCSPRADSIVISRMNTPDLVGECGYVAANYDDLFLPDRLWMTRLFPDVGVQAEWLAQVLSSEPMKASIREVATGTSGSMKNLSKPAFLGLEVDCPPVHEQASITSALTAAGRQVETLDALIEKKRAVKEAVMQRLLTAQQRLPGFDGEWKVMPFGDLTRPERRRLDPRTDEPATRCIELEHIESGTSRLLGSTTLGKQGSLKAAFEPGDVLFGKLRAYLRKYWHATTHGACSTEIWVFRADGELMTSDYLYHLVTTDSFIDAASTTQGTHMPRSDWNSVRQYEVHVPPLAEQVAIAEALTAIDAEIEALVARRDKARLVKRGMAQDLLTGRTRLL